MSAGAAGAGSLLLVLSLWIAKGGESPLAAPVAGEVEGVAEVVIVEVINVTCTYRHQLVAYTYDVLLGPGKLLMSNVPASRGHDDPGISTARTARPDALDWQDRTARGSAGL